MQGSLGNSMNATVWRPTLRVSLRWMILAVGLVLAPLAVSSDCDKECDDIGIWARFSSVNLSVRSPREKEALTWNAQFDNSGFKIEGGAAANGKPSLGTVGMIDGRTMVTKGVELRRGYEIDAIDAPVLFVRLMYALLTRAIPGGPDTVKDVQRVNFSEDQIGIKYATPSAGGHITAPWRVDGTVERVSQDIVFVLHLAGGTQDPLGRDGKPMDLMFTGRLSMVPEPVFVDSMSLAGWKVYGVESMTSARTVGDVRAAVREELSPGKRDPSKDFTGMWKGDCKENFGLQIKPVGDEGMYSVSFCGPGGCFEPGKYRPNTFITGDRSYHVASESEIEVRGGGGFSTYHKCSSDHSPAH